MHNTQTQRCYAMYLSFQTVVLSNNSAMLGAKFRRGKKIKKGLYDLNVNLLSCALTKGYLEGLYDLNVNLLSCALTKGYLEENLNKRHRYEN